MADLLTSLSELRQINYTALDYASLQSELIDYVRTNYASAGIQDDFLDSSAGRVMIDLLSYFGEILAMRVDTKGREAYLPTAIRTQNVINLLKLTGEGVVPPTEAYVTMEIIPSPISNSPITIPARFQIVTVGADGQSANFEMMAARDDYYSSMQLPAGTTVANLTGYEGTFKQEIFVSTGKARQAYELQYYPVISDTVRISVSPKPSSVITADDLVATRITQVDSLVYQYSDVIIYKPSWNADNIVTVDFANELFGKIPPQGQYIYIDYRVGGGIRGNIGLGTISSSNTILDDAGNSISIIFTNQTNTGQGGADQEDIDITKERAPLRTRTAYKLVTNEDYETLLLEIDDIKEISTLDYNTDRRLNPTDPTVPQNAMYIWILPKTGGTMSDDLRQAIFSYCDERRLTAINHYLFDPTYIDYVVNASITYTKTSDRDTVEQDIRTALLNEYGTDNLSFNRTIRISQIISIIQGVNGVSYLSLTSPTVDIPSTYYQVPRLLAANLILTLTRET